MKLITKAAYAKLRKNAANPGGAKPVIKLFNPCGPATWLVSEIDEDGQPDALDVHDEILSAVEDSLFWPSLQAINTTATDLHVFGVSEHSGIERDVEGTMLRESITLTIPAALGNF